MEKYQKEKNSRLLKVYLIVLFILVLISILNLLSGFVIEKEFFEPSMNIIGILAVGIFIFSIYCLIKFIKEKLSKNSN